jgi:glycine cleavage system H lipoate-binding protein
MTKRVIDLLWYRPSATQSGVFEIGLTEEGLEQLRQACYAIIIPVGPFRQGQPMMAFETDLVLSSVTAPFDLEITETSSIFQGCPDQLSTDSVLAYSRAAADALSRL